MRMGQGLRTGLGHGASPVSYRHNFLVRYGSHLAQLSETVWPISVEDYPKNILVKLF